jgi:hypothetical protein
VQKNLLYLPTFKAYDFSFYKTKGRSLQYSVGGFHNQADGSLLGDFRDYSWLKILFFLLNIAPTCLEQLIGH